MNNGEDSDFVENIVVMQSHVFEALSKKIIGCAINVQKTLGPGFLENIYEQALMIELGENGLRYESQREIEIAYHGEKVGIHRLDMVVEDAIIVEFKALSRLSSVEEAQLLNYLKATGLKRGLLINFGASSLQYKRLVWGYEEPIKKSV